MPDHGHLGVSMPSQYKVAHMVGWLTGKAAIRMHRECVGCERHCTGLHVWARGYCVSMVGLDEQVMREYIHNQEQEEKRQEEVQ